MHCDEIVADFPRPGAQFVPGPVQAAAEVADDFYVAVWSCGLVRDSSRRGIISA